MTLKMAKSISIQMTQKGDFKKTFKFLKAMKEKAFLKNLDKFGQAGVDALAAATPKRTGLTARSWTYSIEDDGERLTITWNNTNVVKDYYNVALMIQYGHGTGTGGWVQGIDYINSALKPIFEKMIGDIWEEVKNT